MSDRLTVGYFYSKNLNLYGDNGNVEVMLYRASIRGIPVEVREINIDTKINSENVSGINFIFMGGGPDSAQKDVYEDLLENKKQFIYDYTNAGGVGLYICGSYQLMGSYYKASDGSVLEGLRIFDVYTEHFGVKKPRCIGNTLAVLSEKISEDPVFANVSKFGREITGFENHGGRTFLKNPSDRFSKITMGFGNNSEDKSEGYLFNNSIGTYFHGPVLARNPHLADYLICKSLGLETLSPVDDTLPGLSFTASKKLKQ